MNEGVFKKLTDKCPPDKGRSKLAEAVSEFILDEMDRPGMTRRIFPVVGELPEPPEDNREENEG